MSDNAPTPELVALLELSERATPGIWEMYGGTNHGRVQTADVIVCDGSPPHFMGKEDAKFIAALVNWFRSTRAATVPQGVSVPDWWVLVPREVTPAMLEAAGPIRGYDFHYPGSSPDADHAEWYRTVVAAATTPPPAELGKGDVK